MNRLRAMWEGLKARIRSVPGHVWLGLAIGGASLLIAWYEFTRNSGSSSTNGTDTSLPTLSGVSTPNSSGGAGSTASPATDTATGTTSTATGNPFVTSPVVYFSPPAPQPAPTYTPPATGANWAQALANSPGQAGVDLATAAQTGDFAPVEDLTRALPGPGPSSAAQSGANGDQWWNDPTLNQPEPPPAPPPPPPPSPSSGAQSGTSGDQWWNDPTLNSPPVQAPGRGGGSPTSKQY